MFLLLSGLTINIKCHIRRRKENETAKQNRQGEREMKKRDKMYWIAIIITGLYAIIHSVWIIIPFYLFGFIIGIIFSLTKDKKKKKRGVR